MARLHVQRLDLCLTVSANSNKSRTYRQSVTCLLRCDLYWITGPRHPIYGSRDHAHANPALHAGETAATAQRGSPPFLV